MYDEPEAFLAVHFPPRLNYETRDAMLNHKTRLITEARLLRARNAHLYATVLFSQAGELELRLASSAPKGERPSRNERLVSAASCFGLSGNIVDAIRLRYETRNALDAESQGFFTSLEVRQAAGGILAQRLAGCWARGSAEELAEIFPEAVGERPLLAPRLLHWASYRIARKNGLDEQAFDALRFLIVAIPFHLPFHLVFVDELRRRQDDRRVSHCVELVRAFWDDYRAHAAVTAARLQTEGETELARASAASCWMKLQDVTAENRSAQKAYAAFATIVIGRLVPAAVPQVYEQHLAIDPEDAEVRTAFAITLLRLGDQAGAFRQFLAAASMPTRKTHWPVTFAAAMHLGMDNAEAAEPLLKIAVREARGIVQARNWNNLGVAYARTGRLEPAAQAFAESLRIATIPAVERNLEEAASGMIDRLGIENADALTRHDDEVWKDLMEETAQRQTQVSDDAERSTVALS